MMNHPRFRGEYVAAGADISRVFDSPPLTRGIQLRLPHPNGALRITPANAGNTG